MKWQSIGLDPDFRTPVRGCAGCSSLRVLIHAAIAWLIVALFAVPTYAQTAADVKQVRDEVIAAGINIEHGPGECGRFEIIKHFAWRWRHAGVGLIRKFGAQNGCSAINTEQEPKYAVDAIMYPDGRVWDVIGKGPDGPNSVTWFQQGNTDPALFAPPFDPGPLNTPVPVPVPVPVPTPTPTPPPYDWQSWVTQSLSRIEQKQDAGFATMQRDHLEIRAKIDAPGWFERIVKHPIFIIGSTAVTTWLTNLAVTK